MKTVVFRFTLFMAICFSLVSVAGNTLLWALPESFESTAEYLFETIEVSGVDFLELTSTNDLGHYAGNTRSPDGKNMIGFTLIDGILSTYDVPDSLTFGFYGLNNAGQTVGFYQDVNEISRGVIVQDSKLTQFDFPGATETAIFGVSESGLLIGDIFDADGAIHGFVGSEQFDVPGATITYADDMNAAALLVGSYVDTNGTYHGYIRHPNGSLTTFDYPGALPDLEYLFVNAINDAGVIVFRAKEFDSLEHTYVRLPNGALKELKFPGSVTTVARDIDREGQIVGYYDALDGRRYGFIATPLTDKIVDDFSNVYVVSLRKGLNMISVPLKPAAPMTARFLAETLGATTVIALDEVRQKFVGWTPDAPDYGFSIDGGKGYIVNLPESRQVTFVGAAWTNQLNAAAAPIVPPNERTWAFVVSGRLESERNLNGYRVTA